MGIRANYSRFHVVDEFVDIFLEHLLRVLLNKEIEFCIDLVPGA